MPRVLNQRCASTAASCFHWLFFGQSVDPLQNTVVSSLRIVVQRYSRTGEILTGYSFFAFALGKHDIIQSTRRLL